MEFNHRQQQRPAVEILKYLEKKESHISRGLIYLRAVNRTSAAPAPQKRFEGYPIGWEGVLCRDTPVRKLAEQGWVTWGKT